VSVKFGLGKGIEAILPIGVDEDVDQAAGRSGYVILPLDKITANPHQPRKNFDENALNELAESIRQHGVIQPILVEASDDGDYTIIAGERRSRAARIAGFTEIPAIIRSFSEEQRAVITLIENLQRADLNPIEEAFGYKQLIDGYGLSQEQAAAKVGKNRSTVANALRLLKLPPGMQDDLKMSGISAGHARAILSLEDGEAQKTLFQQIKADALSVREAEKRAGELSCAGKDPAGQSKGSVPRKRDAELEDITQKFIETLGTKVSIEGTLGKGFIRVDYFSMEDLDRIYEIIAGNEGARHRF